MKGRVPYQVKPGSRCTDVSRMECFYHPGASEAGSCRACLKGLCRRCAIEIEGGLACPERCEPMVRALVASLQQSLRFQNVSIGILRSARGLWIGLALVASSVGLYVLAWGLTLSQFREISLLGIPFLALAFLAARLARNTRSPLDRSESSRERAA